MRKLQAKGVTWSANRGVSGVDALNAARLRRKGQVVNPSGGCKGSGAVGKVLP